MHTELLRDVAHADQTARVSALMGHHRGQPLRFLRTLLPQEALDARGQLTDGERPFELGLDETASPDQESPGLRREAPLAHPTVLTVLRIVPLVDLDMDEADLRPGERPA